MRRLVPIMAVLLALAGCGAGSEPAPAAPAGPSVRLPAVPGRPAAGYLDLRVSGDRGALVSVASPEAGRIEMHETVTAGGTSTMRPLARIPVGDGETLAFVPGGRHLMLFDLAPAVQAGGRIRLTFHFERGEPVTIAASVLATGDDAGHGDMGH